MLQKTPTKDLNRVTNAESVYRLYYEIIAFTAKLNPLYALLLHFLSFVQALLEICLTIRTFVGKNIGIEVPVSWASVIMSGTVLFSTKPWVTSGSIDSHFDTKKNMLFIPHRTHVTGTFTYICLIFMVFMYLTIQSSHGSVMGYENHVVRFPGVWISLFETCRTLDTKEP